MNESISIRVSQKRQFMGGYREQAKLETSRLYNIQFSRIDGKVWRENWCVTSTHITPHNENRRRFTIFNGSSTQHSSKGSFFTCVNIGLLFEDIIRFEISTA